MMPAVVPAGAPFRASYIDYFQIAAHDSFHGKYAAALTPYDVPLVQNAPATFTPDAICALVVGA